MRGDKRLVLFDIDGTLLSTGQAGRKAIRHALEHVYGGGWDALTSEWTFSGKTDPQICQELLGAAGYAPEAIEAGMKAFFAAYLEGLAKALAGSPRAHLKPGVVPLLDALAEREDVTLALLTGNMVEGARIKLSHFGIDGYFAFGAYGSDSAVRAELPAVAVERAQAHVGRRFAGKEVVIIGDTEHDITCGTSLGVKAIAVATGVFGLDALAPHGPDHLFADLSDTERVLAAILD